MKASETVHKGRVRGQESKMVEEDGFHVRRQA